MSGAQTIDQVRALALTSDFVIVKASEGQGWQSPAYPAQRAAAAQGCSLTGAYHFAWPNQDPALEAANFLKAAALQPGDLTALDLEREAGGETWTTRVTYALTWLRAVSGATGTRPLVYVNLTWLQGLRGACSNPQWAELTSYPLWLAHYTGTPGVHGDTAAWDLLIHQYAVDTVDHDWTPDTARLRAAGRSS